MYILHVLGVTAASFLVCNLVTHPKSKIWHKMLPLQKKVKIKGIELFPSIRINVRSKIIHFHHWFNFSVLLAISVFVTSKFLDSWLTRSFLMGGILQGLSIKEARHMIYPKEKKKLP